jgi:crotonobetainyl-CoA:carnitine CoA-transferase CaiB-like acyl-CoA transferase
VSYESGIFAGLKVIDCASFIAGPAATTILSDFGADVVKLESPGSGDPWRHVSRIPPMPAASKNYLWRLTNRNKRSVALNLKSPHASDVIQRLVRSADVFVCNFPPRVRKALGLTYEDLSRLNPRLVYADISGYGDHGPESDKPGFDITAYWARTGLMEAARNAGCPPALPVPGSGDHATASTLFGAIVTGLFRREKTGTGCHVSTSLLADGTWAAGAFVQAALDGARFAEHTDRTRPINALANAYQASDSGWLQLVMVEEEREWPGLVQAVERPELLADGRFANSAKRKANAAALVEVLDAAFRERTQAEWRTRLDQAHVTFGVIQSVEELARDPQLFANEILRPIADGGATPSYTVDSPVKVHEEQKVAPRPAPDLGEHTVEVLTELGYDAADIDALRESGTIPALSEAAAPA